MSKLKSYTGRARNLNLFTEKKKILFILGILILYCLIIMGSTYAYLYVNKDDTNTLTGNLGTADVNLTITRIVPDTNMPLVPLLDAALGNALTGNGGVSSCIDANHNLSCEVYKISLTNPSTTNLQLTGDITLVASGENNIYHNLKWEEIEDPTTRKSEYTTNGMETSILDKNFYLEAGDTKIYYIAIWISENGQDQRETDQGVYGGIVEFNTSNGDGVTATFGEFDKDYCTNNGITSLSDCLLITEKYSNTTDEAKEYIATKVADFTNTAPIISYAERLEKNVTGTSIISTTNKIYVGTSYSLDTSTGAYYISNTSLMEMTNALSTDTTKYYTCNNQTSNGNCTTMYVIYTATSSTSNGTTTYKAKKLDRYTQDMVTQNISGKGLYVAEDDYGNSYYYRGKVENNYLSFAGFIWRIVRINGDGSIRLIYSGTSTSDTGSATSIGTSAFNSDPYDAAMVGYKYGLSKTLQHTTATNLNYNNISATTSYYFGTEYTTNDSTKKLSISGSTVQGTLADIWGTGSYPDYKYTCFSTSATETCTTLIEIKSYVNQTQVKANYHSYLSESYESTYTDELDSTIIIKIDDWYKTNIEDKNYSSYLVDNMFCNDRSITSGDGFSLNQTTIYGAYTRNYTNKSPSFKCPRQVDQFTVTKGTTIGNGELTYPVGLLTADEVAYAGGKVGTMNKAYYLYTGQYYWLGSPSYFSSWDAAAHAWRVNSSGYLYLWDWTSHVYGVRPVINLRSDIEISGGNGTQSAPYVVKTN